MAEKDQILIGPPTVTANGKFIRSTFPVEGLSVSELWFDVEEEYGDFVSDTCDAAVASLLIAAMDEGKSLKVSGPLSESFLWGVRNTVIPSVAQNKPFLSIVEIEAEELRDDESPVGSAVLTGMSCGVDSFSAIQDHALATDLPDTHRVTHLIQSHFGHHGYGATTNDRAEARWRNVQKAAEAVGLPVFRVYSNQHEFYSPIWDDRLNWLATLTVRNSAAPLLLQKGARRFYLGSGHSWREIGVGPYRDMTRMDPILLPALSTRRVELLAVGTEHTRVEKTRRIATLEAAQQHLDVCLQEGATNCSYCEKCLRTLLTIELLGHLGEFHTRFDLDEYRRHRTEFIGRVWLDYKEDHCHLEIKELMDEIEYHPHAMARVWELGIRGWRLIPMGLRKKVRALAGR